MTPATAESLAMSSSSKNPAVKVAPADMAIEVKPASVPEVAVMALHLNGA